MTIKIQKRTTNEWFITAIIAIVFLWGTLLDFLNLPSAVKYIADLMWLILMLMLLANSRNTLLQNTEKLVWIVFAFWLVTFIGYITNVYSILYYMWGIRNNFRFFIFFFGCVAFLKEKTAQKIIIWFEKLVYVNFIVSCFQFVVMGYSRDYLGGIFGVSAGCNGKQIVFLGITTAWSAIKYLNGRKKLLTFSIECVMSILIAAVAELKFYYILFALIIAASTLITKFSLKKMIIILVCVLGIIVGTTLLTHYYPEFAGIFSLDKMLSEASTTRGYTGKGGLNRLTTVPIISVMFLDTTWRQLLGLGLGYCETATFSILNTPFFRQYGYLHYNFFSSAFAYLETGIIGLTVYCFFFVAVYFLAKKREKQALCNREWGQLAQIGALLSLIFIIYNSSMRAEEAYLMYFVLSLPFLGGRSQNLKC